MDFIERKTNLFILENEKPTADNPDVQPYRCSYCGELAVIERDSDYVPVSASCNCEDATTELTIKGEVLSLSQKLGEKETALNEHINTRTFDEDTRIMRYEDELITLKERYNISQ